MQADGPILFFFLRSWRWVWRAAVRFSLTTDWVDKSLMPLTTRLSCTRTRTPARSSYSRLVDSPDFNLEVGVNNGPVESGLFFWFYVLPIPFCGDESATQHLIVDVQLEPKSPQITFDPWQVFFLRTNQVRVPPTQVWLGTNTSRALSVTNSTRFVLEFPTWGRIHPDWDLPFQLSIEGITVSGQTVPLLPVTFVPTAITRPEFRLPY